MKRFYILLSVCLLVFLVGCNSGKNTKSPDGTVEVIKVGATISTTGNFAFASQQGIKGLELWVDEVNAQGGLYVASQGKKVPVELVTYDDRSDTQQVTRLYERLITEDKVDLLFAPFGSTLTGVATTVTERYGKPLIIWSAAADTIYAQGHKYIISATQIAASLAQLPGVDHAYSLGYRNIAVVYQDEPFPAAQALGTKEYAEKLGMNVVFYDHYSKDSLDYSSMIRRIANTNPDALFVNGYMEDQANFLRQMKENDLTFDYVYMLYSAQPEWKDLTGKDGSYIYGHVWVHEDLIYDVTDGMNTGQFYAAYDRLFPNATHPADFQTGLAYGAGVLMQKFVEDAGSFEAGKIKQAALALSGKVTVITGEYNLMETGKQLGMRSVVTQAIIDDAGYRLVIVHPADVKTHNAVDPFPAWNQR
ncbi:MAG: amino acid ABC transporter substrate-binding protein [Dethiobacter sp.]|jgi:branched-chain amino acid transport system substrate-binding protein|nr:amino acid ABC transporter substrate-binding protein [Dethiobacter sp.]